MAKGAFEQIADSAAGAAGQMIVDSLTWWVRTPSVDPQNPAVVTAQAYTLPLIALVLMGSVLVQAIRMTVSRKRVRPVLVRRVRRELRWPPVRWPPNGPARPPTGRPRA